MRMSGNSDDFDDFELNERIGIVRDGYWEQYQDITLGEALENTFSPAVWNVFITDTDDIMVTFEGVLAISGQNTEVLLQFLIDPDDETFAIESIEMNHTKADYIFYEMILYIAMEHFMVDTDSDEEVAIFKTKSHALPLYRNFTIGFIFDCFLFNTEWESFIDATNNYIVTLYGGYAEDGFEDVSYEVEIEFYYDVRQDIVSVNSYLADGVLEDREQYEELLEEAVRFVENELGESL